MSTVVPQRTRVRGRVGGPMSTRELGDKLKDRAKRKIKNKLTAKKTRDKIRKRAEKAIDKATFGPGRRKLKRIRRRLHDPVTHHDVADAALPQTETYCDRYIGGKPEESLRPRNKRGSSKRGQAYCPSCRAEVELKGGKIPPHDPGPPPFTHCSGCNAFLPKVYPNVRNAKKLRRIGGCYNDIMCPACYQQIENDGGGTLGEDGMAPSGAGPVQEGLAW